MSDKIEARNEQPEVKAPEGTNDEPKAETPETAKPKKAASKRKPATKRAKYPVKAVRAIAQQCWWERTSKSRLAKDHDLTEEQVDEIRGSETYREAVMSLMVGQRSDPRVFADWHKTESTKPEWLAGRMGIAEEDVVKMFKAAKDVHAKIVAGDVKAPKVVPSLDGKVAEFKVADDGKVTTKLVVQS